MPYKIKVKLMGLGDFAPADLIQLCEQGKCPRGWELYCFPAGKNPHACVLRLNEEAAKNYRKPGECAHIVLYKGEPRTCSTSETKQRGTPCATGKQISRDCPMQRRKKGLPAGKYAGDIRDILPPKSRKKSARK